MDGSSEEENNLYRKIWDNFEEYILIALYSIIIPLLFINIIMRYFFGNAIKWSEELARYIFLWQIWLGASYGVKKSKHIRIDMIFNKLSKNAAYNLENLITVICLCFCAFLAFRGNELVSKVLELGQLSAALRLPMGYPYLSVPVGSGLMVIRYLEKLYENVKMYKLEVQ